MLIFYYRSWLTYRTGTHANGVECVVRGMRQGEVRNLARSHVDLKRRAIRLGPLYTKERNHKRVPIHGDFLPVLERALSDDAEGM
jgi:integrase